MFPSRTSVFALALLSTAVAAENSKCFEVFANPGGGVSGPVNCSTISGASSSNTQADACFLACTLCSTPELAVGLQVGSGTWAACNANGGGAPPPLASSVIASDATNTIYNVTQMHGWFWLDDAGDVEANASQALLYLVASMPRRDLILLARSTFLIVDFLCEHVRAALQTRAWSASMGVDWDTFLDAVLPYAVFDEKRDLWWRWRPRFAQLFGPIIASSGATNITAAMKALAAAIPAGGPLGVLALFNGSAPVEPVPGMPISWRSEVSPAFISPQQVATHGGSCTGTAIVLVAAARSVGIPARLEGCAESVVRGDDHRWAAFYDPSDSGPFGDYWHTKEGVSAGNAGGPWDAPSGPMLGCLAGVVPGSSLDTLWATSWGSKLFQPALWANSSWAQAFSFVGGINRCGAYCSAWGCGVNNSIHYTQDECGPA